MTLTTVAGAERDVAPGDGRNPAGTERFLSKFRRAFPNQDWDSVHAMPLTWLPSRRSACASARGAICFVGVTTRTPARPLLSPSISLASTPSCSGGWRWLVGGVYGVLSLLAAATVAAAVEGNAEPLIRLPTQKPQDADAAAPAPGPSAAEEEDGVTRWAVLVAGSKGYDNYRHQADVCRHAYQILKKGEVKEENIVVFMYDDIAHDPQNPRRGVIINHPKGKDIFMLVFPRKGTTPERRRRPSRGFWVFTRDRLGREGIEYLEIAFKKEIGAESVDDFVASPSARSFPRSSPPPPTAATHQSKSRYEQLKGESEEKLRVLREIKETVVHRKHFDSSVNFIGKLLFGFENGPSMLEAPRSSGQPVVDDLGLFEEDGEFNSFLVRVSESHCGSITQYGMKHMRAFANICNNGVSEAEMKEASVSACGGYNLAKWSPLALGYSA
ncbi:hypothetical protein QYE76_045250 [Lolium multiflorum]|uniref:Legumain prodomain domain-containing protein n=1 Tax=Lolium multiflorum TaxID=4521 RepID=A0AAD8TMD1_LOLMU|nr:hypothetical protein QYE76_045250 [Lolium multiflorum]